MPRVRREKGVYCIYHIIQRGNDKKAIFYSNNDRKKFLFTLARAKNKYNCMVYAYCLMDNHIHLLIDDNGNDISLIIKSMNIAYANYFNRTYERSGHLFQDRFKSELVTDEKYLLEVSKYIHNNPVKAGMVQNPEEYKWSSFNAYTGNESEYDYFLNVDKILSLIANTKSMAIREYVNYVNSCEEQRLKVMDIEDELWQRENSHQKHVTTLKEAREKIEEILKKYNIGFDKINSDLNIRNMMIKQIRENSTLTLKEIGQLFGGLCASRVSRILK